MVLKGVLLKSDMAHIIFRAVWEDGVSENLDEWIDTYFTYYWEFLNCEREISEYIIFLQPTHEDDDYTLIDLGAADIKMAESIVNAEDADGVITWAVDSLPIEKIANAFIPSSNLKMFGIEGVAAEVLKGTGWKGVTQEMVCPSSVREWIKSEIARRNKFSQSILLVDACKEFLDESGISLSFL